MRLAFIIAAAMIGTPALAQSMDHAMPGMDHGSMDHGAMPSADTPAVGPGTDAVPGHAAPPDVMHDRAADRFFGAAAMAPAEAAMMAEHSRATYSKVTLDLVEYQFRNGHDGYRWEAEAWFGDIDRVIGRTKGEGDAGGGVDHAEFQIVYAKALDPWWSLQGGVRHDIWPRPGRTYATLGMEGRAPYQFDIQAALFVSHRGELTGRIEATYDQRVTQRLVLQPRAEIDVAAQDMADIRTGHGLSSAELGLRLRYEIRRELAPYIGVSWQWALGRTAAYARADGHGVAAGGLVLGLRAWF